MSSDSASHSEPFVPNYDESLVGNLPVPDVLLCEDGTRVTNRVEWEKKRRPELLALFAREMFGRTPFPRRIEKVEVQSEIEILEGLGRMTQVALHYGPSSDQVAHVAYFSPARAKGPVPFFISLNFGGNHEVMHHPALRLSDRWFVNHEKDGYAGHRATEASRGVYSHRWPIEAILERGYGVATAYYGDFDPDFDDGFQNGVHALAREAAKSSSAGDEWSSIGAWAWGLSLMADYLETLPVADCSRFIVLGLSRLGKTALWAGAQDERFSIVISNDSGAGGAALSRRNFGQSVGDLSAQYPHWFCGNFKKYSRNEAALPFDQHALIALMAPRPVYIASATEDLWADPKGEFLSGKLAGPVYELFGLEGLSAEEPPPPDTSVGDFVGYHNRTGPHDIFAFDWERYMDFAERHWARL